MATRARNLLLTGGIAHAFDEAAPALARLLEGHGIDSTVTDDIDGGLADLAAGSYDLLTVYALRWGMDGDKYAPHRAQWAYRLPAAGRAAISGHLAAGGGLLGLHTAAICFDDWPQWKHILGSAWAWGRSGHPPYGRVEARPAADHPIVRDLPAFALDDEVYGDLDLAEDVVPLAQARAAGGGDWQPVLWARAVGGGRVVFDGLGHDAASLDHPVHRRIVARAALWALGRGDQEVVSP